MPTRIAFLENDADTFEAAVASMNKKLNYISGIGVAILLSLISALAVVAFK